MKTCVITGVNGQLGQFLAKLLLESESDIQIVGTIRHKSCDDQYYIFDKSLINLEVMDLSDVNSIEQLIIKYKPDYYINTAAIAFVGESWDLPFQHINLNVLGVLSQLEAIRKYSPKTRYFNMGTSEEFLCDKNNFILNENSKILPRNPYGCSKVASRHLINVYRNNYNLFALQGWTLNFESELRGEKYVTRKITKGVARILKEKIDGNKFTSIKLGNIDSFRSWQYAQDVASGIWMMINNVIPTEYLLSVNECYSVRQFIEESFICAGFKNLEWIKGEKPEDEILIDKNSGYTLIEIDPKFYRPQDAFRVQGDSSKIFNDLGWKCKVGFQDLVKRMVRHDIRLTCR